MSARRFLLEALRPRSGDFALLLPHFQLRPGRLIDVEEREQALGPELELALRLCDGTRTLGAIAAEAKVSQRALLKQHARGRIVLWRSVPATLPRDETPPARIVVSPHLDDAALSLGASMLTGEAREWLVLDVFSRSAWWRLGRWEQLDLLQRIRREEERTMARLAGVQLADCDLPEALLRGHSFDEVFSPESAADAGVVAQVEAEVTRRATRWRDAEWYLPLGVGAHLDHRVCRDAALRGLQKAGIGQRRIFFYEDLPYAAKLRGVPDFSLFLPGWRLSPRLQPGTQAQMRWKLELNRVYWSQLAGRDIRKLETYARRVGEGAPVERVWAVEAAVGAWFGA